MMTTIFPWIMSIIGIIGFYLAGKKVWWAWYVNLANQVIWLAYSIGTQQWGFLLATLFYVGVFSKNAQTWTNERFGGPSSTKPSWRWWAHRLGWLPSPSCDVMGVPFGWRKPNPVKYEDFKIDFNEIAYHRDPDAPGFPWYPPPASFIGTYDNPNWCNDLNVDYDIVCTRAKGHFGAHTGGGKQWPNENKPAEKCGEIWFGFTEVEPVLCDRPLGHIKADPQPEDEVIPHHNVLKNIYWV